MDITPDHYETSTDTIEYTTTVWTDDGEMDVTLTEPGMISRFMLAGAMPSDLPEKAERADNGEDITVTQEDISFLVELFETVTDKTKADIETISSETDFNRLIDLCATVVSGEDPAPPDESVTTTPSSVGNVDLNDDGTISLEELR